MKDFLELLGVIGQQLANLLWYDRIISIAGFRIQKVREEAEREFYERGFAHGEQAERDRKIAEGSDEPN